MFRSNALPALAALGLLTLASPAAAQRTMIWSADDRPRIGVMLESGADSASARYGARIREVVPESPAERAGLKAGDIITRFNGTALGRARGEDAEGSTPPDRLVALVGKLSVGDTAEVEYRREGQTRKTRVVAEAGRDVVRHFEFRMPDMPEMAPEPFGGGMMRLEGGPEGMRQLMLARGGHHGAALADMNEGLGEYFGTREGALVLETPADTTSPLRAGDVIVAIDGRPVTSAAHGRRILLSYEAGERARIDVMRKQRKTTLTWTFSDRPVKLERRIERPRSRERA